MQIEQLQRYITGVFILFIVACDSNTVSHTEDAPSDTTNAAINVDPKLSDSARLLLIEKLNSNGDSKNAMAQIDLLLQKEPGNPAFLYIKGETLESLKDTSAALRYYHEANAAAGFFLQAKMRMLNLYAESGDRKTIPLADTLLSNQDATTFYSDILLMKGIYFTKRNLPDSAEHIFTKIMREDYTYLQAYIERGLLYYDQKKYVKALEVFSLSTEVKNDFADGYFWVAKTCLKLSNKEAAVLNFKKSLALDPSITEAREQLQSLGAIQ